MSQVLVGEIVFKLKADADNLVRSLRQAAQEVRRLEADQKRLTTAASEAKSAIDKESKALDVNSSAMKNASNATRNLGRDKGRMSAVITSLTAAFAKLAIKIAIVVPLMRLAAQAFSALATGAANMLSSLVPLSGLLIALPGTILALVSSTLVLKAAFAGVSEGVKALASGDMTKINQQFARMSPLARQAALAITSFKDTLGAGRAAEAGFLPGFITGLQKMVPFIGMFRQEIALLGRTLGGLTAQAGGLLSTVRFYRDFQRIGSANRIVVENLGKGFLGLVDAFRSIMSAGAPLLIFLSNGARKMGELAAAKTSAARASGALTRFFERAAVAGDRMRQVFSGLIGGVSGLFRAMGAGRQIGFLDGLANTMQKFKDFTNSARGQNAIADYFRRAQPALDAMKGLLGDIFKMFTQMSAGGGLVQLINVIRTDLLPAVVQLAQVFSSRLLPTLIDLLGGFSAVFTALSNSPLPMVVQAFASLASAIAKTVTAVPVLGQLVVTVGALYVMMARLAKITIFQSLATGAVAFGAALRGALATAAFSGPMAGLAALRGSLTATAAAAGALKKALVLTGIGAGIVILGTIFSKISGNADELTEKVQKFSDAKRDSLRVASGGNNFAYADLLEKEAQQVDKALAAHRRLEDFKRESRYQQVSNPHNFDGQKAAEEEIKRLEDHAKRALEAVGFTGKQAAEEAGKHQKTIRDDLAATTLENERAVQIQVEGYNRLTGANLELASATAESRGKQIEMIAAMSAAGQAAYDAVMATGDLSEIWSSLGDKANFSTLLEGMNKAVADARKFGENISAALKNGFDPAAIAELVAKGPAAAGPILAELAATTDKTLIAQFNSFSERLREQAILVAEQARVLNQAVNFEDDSLSKQLPEITAALATMYGQGVQTFDGLVAKLKLNKVEADALAESMRTFGINIAGLPPVGIETAQANAKIKAIAGEIEKPGVKPVGANVLAALDKINAVRVAAGLKALTPVDASITAALAEIARARREASREVTMPVRIMISGRGELNQVRGELAQARALRQADGGVVDYFANGGMRENHTAQIAPAGSWRVWAEPETGGEAYIPLSMSKRGRSMEILKQTARRMGVSVEGFANGSPVAANPNTPGSLTRAALTTRRGGGGVEELRALIDAYTAYVAKLEQATRRGELVLALRKAQAEANKKVKRTLEEKRSAIEAVTSAQKALASFDTDARRNAEIAAVEKTIAAIEKETAAREEATAKKRTTEDNMFRVGAMSTDNYLGLLDIRIASEEKFTDAWTSLVEQRKSIMDSEVQAAEAAAAAIMRTQDNMFKVGATNAYDYIAILDQRIAAEVQFSDNWTSLVQQREQIIQSETDRLRTAANEQVQILERQASELQRIADQAQSTAEQSLADLNRLLDQKIQLEHEIAVEEWRLQMARYEAQQQFQNDSLAATENYNQAVTQAQTDHATNYQRILAKTQEESAKISERYQKDAADALKKHNADIDSILRDRHDVLTSWARIDEEAGPLTALPVEWISGNVRQQIGQFDKWSKALEAARDRGVSEQVISALNLDAGPQTLGQLEAFAAATESEIADLNALVIARSAQAGKQVADEARKTHTALGRALTEASRLYNEEATALRQAHKQQQVELATQMRIDLANENATLNQALADARDTLSTAMAAANARMNDSIVAATAQAATNIAALRDQLASLGFQAGRSLNDAIALGMASGLPGIQNAVAWVQYYAQSATNAAIAAANALTNAQNAATAAANVSFTPPPAPSPQATPSSSSQPASIGGFQPVSANPAHTTIEQIQAATNFGYSMPMNAVRGIHGSTVYIPQGVTPQFTPPIGEGWGWNPGGNYWTRSKFDKGGVLAPGLTAAFNATGRNEYIMTGDQILDKFADIAKVQSDGSGGGGDTVVNVYLDGELVRGVARTEVVKGLGKLATEIASGRR